MSSYDGVVVFVQGVHYAVDAEGDPDLNRPLRVAEDGNWRDAEEDEPLHNDTHHERELELPVGGEG